MEGAELVVPLVQPLVEVFLQTAERGPDAVTTSHADLNAYGTQKEDKYRTVQKEKGDVSVSQSFKTDADADS